MALKISRGASAPSSPNARIITTLPDGKICDFIDQKIRPDSPEEYVRQNIERRLVLELGYRPEQIAVEFRLRSAAKAFALTLQSSPKGVSTTRTTFS